MNNHREAFEAWINRQFQEIYGNDAPLEKDDGSGNFYEDHRVSNAWWGWQAALAAQAQQPVTAEDYLRDKYGAYRGHPEWRALEDAFNAGKAARVPQQEIKQESFPVSQCSYARITDEQAHAVLMNMTNIIGMRNGEYFDSTPLLHVGSSSFEDWYQQHPKACTGDKQLARDSYAAGMGDPLVTYARSVDAGMRGELNPKGEKA